MYSHISTLFISTLFISTLFISTLFISTLTKKVAKLYALQPPLFIPFSFTFYYIQKNPNLLSTCHVFPDTHIVVLHFQKTCYKNFFHPFKHTSYPVFMFYDTKIQVYDICYYI